MNRRHLVSSLAATVFAAVSPAFADLGIPPAKLHGSYVFDSGSQHKIRVTVVTTGLKHPFAVALLPSGDALVSERGGALRLVHDVTGAKGPAKLDAKPVGGIPAPETVYPNVGLHDVVLHPQFGQNKLIYFTFNKSGNPPQPTQEPSPRPFTLRESRVSLMRGTFTGSALTNVEELFVAESGGSTSGSRIAFGNDGLVYISTGSPFNDAGQHLDSSYGKVLRLTETGQPAPGNPFVGQAGARPEVFSLGHRDHIGLAIHPQTGAVLSAEFGPNGGDELNLILPGRNYGWPKVSFGRQYEGPRVSESPVAEGIEQPLLVWLPAIAPSGLTFYSGDRFPLWKGNLFVGSLQRGGMPGTGGLERIVMNDKLEELRRETLLTDLHQRIRDVRQGPDGLLYVLTDQEDGALLRIEPTT